MINDNVAQVLGPKRPTIGFATRMQLKNKLDDPDYGWMNVLGFCIAGMQKEGDEMERELGKRFDAFIKHVFEDWKSRGLAK